MPEPSTRSSISSLDLACNLAPEEVPPRRDCEKMAHVTKKGALPTYCGSTSSSLESWATSAKPAGTRTASGRGDGPAPLVAAIRSK